MSAQKERDQMQEEIYTMNGPYQGVCFQVENNEIDYKSKYDLYTMSLLSHTSSLECLPLLSAHISMTLPDSTFSRKPIPTLSHQPIGTFASTRH